MSHQVSSCGYSYTPEKTNDKKIEATAVGNSGVGGQIKEMSKTKQVDVT